jgi:hypothetical protein
VGTAKEEEVVTVDMEGGGDVEGKHGRWRAEAATAPWGCDH